MKGLVLAICFFAALSAVSCTHGERMLTSLKMKYMEGYLQERQAIDELTSKLEEVCPGSKVNFEKAIEDMKACADKIDESVETSCSIAKNKMPKCLKPIIEVFKDCMPEQSRELPEFFLKSLLNGVDYICKTDGEHIFELGNTCLLKPNPMTQTCRRKLTMKMQQFKRTGLGVEEVCNLMQNLRPCLKSHLFLSCGSPITQEAAVGIFDAFMTTCKTTAEGSNELKEGEDIAVNKLEDFS